MDKETRSAIEKATQAARRILETDFAEQLEGTFDIHLNGKMSASAGAHLGPVERVAREKLMAAIEHKRGAGMKAAEAVADCVRDATFTTLNRFIALKMLEARELVQECLTKGEQSAGYKEFCGLAPGLLLLDGGVGYRLYIESLFDELSTEVKVLFDRRDPSSVLWPKRATFEQLLEILNATELARVWGEDETIGWVYQFFNGPDERRRMREESQAPRNGRELAVRNQFFTPRYVVQFLTDNTLGRIWYEMREMRTALADKCEYMIRTPGEEFSPRKKKDPRDLRVLDPACGSGHFLLYAFDLLLAIYEEAHADPQSPKYEATGKTLAEEYPSVHALRKAVPGLVLAHNLYGVDIDPRCAQIAQLALWMRAQKAYRDFGIPRGERPQIRRSNIVVAEPLVAHQQIATEFVAKLGDAELGRVFTSLVESLSLAGDLGLLLRVEQLVTRQAKRGQTGDLFAPPAERIRAALDRFVREEASATNTRRRLFADDAAYGVALLDVAEKKFDVVLMNPPFGQGSTRAKKVFDKMYPRTKNDIYAAFVQRGVELLVTRGRLGAITSRTGFFLSTFQNWRDDMLSTAPPVAFADLGLGVMDAALVEAAAYCLERSPEAVDRPTVLLRVLEELDDKALALRSVIASQGVGSSGQWFVVHPRSFSAVPGKPFAYWLSDALRSLFATRPAFESSGRIARVGLQTSDDFRFVRAWWALESKWIGERWLLFAKGGKYSPYFSDLYLCVKWERRGYQVRAFEKSKQQNVDLFLRPGLTWPLRTKSDVGFRLLPRGSAFGHKGPAAFVDGDSEDALLSLMAVVSSKPFRALIEVQLAAAEPTGRGGVARSYEVGVVQRTPLPIVPTAKRDTIAGLARRAWSIKRSLDTVNEVSHAFTLPALLQFTAGSDNGDSTSLTERFAAVQSELESIQSRIDDEAFCLYGLDDDERQRIEAGFGSVNAGEPETMGDDSEDPEDEDTRDDADTATLVAASLSWFVGVAFGRFDPRLATGERPIPPEPEPFDPLPARSPGMWPEDEHPNPLGTLDGCSLVTQDGHQLITQGLPDILVDDDGHQHDLTTHALGVANRVKVDVPDDLRAWYAKEFFPFHIKMYSKSRRKAPIYWQLATPSASYSVWLYIHAFTPDTMVRVGNDYVAPKLAIEEERLERLRAEAAEGSSAQRKAFDAQARFVDELRAFLEEVRRVAPLWNPDLDDGVILNFAPLWRLVPQHKAWQKEVKAKWDELCEGKYDWAHLAMHLWPERVVPKCADDRSFAIAHGLEDVFWFEDDKGKWHKRPEPTRPVAELVAERTSPTVKAALQALLDAPTPTGGKARKRAK